MSSSVATHKCTRGGLGIGQESPAEAHQHVIGAEHNQRGVDFLGNLRDGLRDRGCGRVDGLHAQVHVVREGLAVQQGEHAAPQGQVVTAEKVS